MGERLNLLDGELSAAGVSLGCAAGGMAGGSSGRPSGRLQSLNGIGSEIDDYLRGLQTAREALADAAKTASRTVGDLMANSAELDAHLARTVYAGYALGTEER